MNNQGEAWERGDTKGEAKCQQKDIFFFFSVGTENKDIKSHFTNLKHQALVTLRKPSRYPTLKMSNYPDCYSRTF